MNHWLKFISLWACSIACLGLVVDIPTPVRLIKGEPYERIDLPVALLLHRNASTVFIDARASGLFVQGHIVAAISMAEVKAENEAVIRRVRSAPNIVLYGGRDKAEAYRALKALSGLRLYGLKYYEGGWPQWSALGLPTTEPSS